jgi:hypothetical protein
MLKRIMGYIEVGVSVIFFLNSVSDIQLGFAFVLFFDGFNKILK